MFYVGHQNGRLSKELDLVSHHVRTRLDELKRQEVSRLRMLLKAKLDSTNTQSESETQTSIRSHTEAARRRPSPSWKCYDFDGFHVSLAGLQMDHASLLKQFEHLDPHNQNTFEAKDLELLISTVQLCSRGEMRSEFSVLHVEALKEFKCGNFCVLVRPPRTWRIMTPSGTRSSSATRC